MRLLVTEKVRYWSERVCGDEILIRDSVRVSGTKLTVQPTFLTHRQKFSRYVFVTIDEISRRDQGAHQIGVLIGSFDQPPFFQPRPKLNHLTLLQLFERNRTHPGSERKFSVQAVRVGMVRRVNW